MIMQHVHPFDVISRVLSERLLRREASDQLCVTMGAADIDWERVVGVASAHFVLPALAAALRDLGPLKSRNDELGLFLQAVHAANRERNAELRDELEAAAKVLNRAGIEPVLLKGAIRLRDELYPDDGWRMLRDLDLLAPKAALAERSSRPATHRSRTAHSGAKRGCARSSFTKSCLRDRDKCAFCRRWKS